MQQLISDLKEWNISLSDEQINQLEDYYKLLIEWNENINLTSITDYDEVLKKHYLDSMALTLFFENNNCFEDKKFSLIDIGTGAGFPGMVLKILYPDSKIVLLDSLNKRINFLDEVIDKLCLENISTVHSRSEDLAHNEDFREKFDFAVSRAVSNLSTLSEYCLPFVKVGGYFIPYKSDKLHEELPTGKVAIEKLGGNLDNILDYTLPNSDFSRSLVIVSKVKSTPKKFPRKAGIPSKQPLA